MSENLTLNTVMARKRSTEVEFEGKVKPILELALEGEERALTLLNDMLLRRVQVCKDDAERMEVAQLMVDIITNKLSSSMVMKESHIFTESGGHDTANLNPREKMKILSELMDGDLTDPMIIKIAVDNLYKEQILNRYSPEEVNEVVEKLNIRR